jgi:hypothetical protein
MFINDEPPGLARTDEHDGLFIIAALDSDIVAPLLDLASFPTCWIDTNPRMEP